MNTTEKLLWNVRAFIYAQFAETTRPPAVEATAQHFGITPGEAAELFSELEDRHAIFLEPGTHQIRMAFPFSGIPTDFKVGVNGKTYAANCAWDMLGIPAALHASTASIDSVCAESREPIHLEIRNGKLLNTGALIQFAVPFSRWYEDLPHT